VPSISADTLVRLRSGAVYQGELVERIPGDHVTLRLVTGEIKRIGDEELAAVEETRSAGHGVPVELQPVQVDLQSTRPEAALIRIASLSGGLDGRFNGSLGGQVEGRRECVAPCGLAVAPGRFIIGGPGLRPSEAFELTGRNRKVRVDAEPGSESRMTGGIVLTGIAVLSGLVGFAMLEVAAEGSYDDGSRGAYPDTSSRHPVPAAVLPVSLVLLGLGAVLGIVGVSMAANSQTKVDLTPVP
jgi:hypothetical protein